MTATVDITLKLLQERRQAACEALDWPAYHAFDLMIGCALGEPEMYLRSNPGVAAVKADSMREHIASGAVAATVDRLIAGYLDGRPGAAEAITHSNTPAAQMAASTLMRSLSERPAYRQANPAPEIDDDPCGMHEERRRHP